MDASRDRQPKGFRCLKGPGVSTLRINATNHQHLIDPGRAGAGEDLEPVVVELRHVDVALAVHEMKGRIIHNSSPSLVI